MTRQLCTFTVGELLLGLDVARVQEVVRGHALTPVPLAPPSIVGLANLRGQIVPALCLRQRFGIAGLAGGAERRTAKDTTAVVVRAADGPVSLLVDEIGDVTDVEDALFQPRPETLPVPARHLVSEVCRLPGKVLMVIDPEKTVDVLDRDAARED